MAIGTRPRGVAALLAAALTVGSLSFASPAGAAVATSAHAITRPASGVMSPNVTQTFSWAAPASSTYGVGLTSGQLDAQSNVAGSTVYKVVTGPGSTAGDTLTVGTVLPAGTYSVKATFTPTDTTDYTTQTATNSLVVTPAELRAKANNASRAYGAANPTFSLSAYTGFVNGDTASVVTGSPTFSTTATSSSPVGSYPIDVNQNTLSAPNYTFSLLPGDLEVGPITLTVTASNGSQTYGDTTAPTITPSYSGFVNGDGPSSLSSAPTCTANVNAGTPVGTYSSSCIGGSSTNYSLQFATGTVTVNRAVLTVTASDGSQTYGDTTAPAITATYSGFRNSDNASSLSSLPTCVANVTATSAVGTYTSSCTGGAGSNYTLHYANGVVTVGSATLTVTASNGTQTYGDTTAPTITPTYSGFVNGQSATVLSHAASCSANVSATTGAGSYASTCSGASAPNYTVHYVNGVVTVNQATLTVTASGGSQTYGDIVPPAITPSYSGFLNGDTASALSQPATCTSGVAPTTPAGTYSNTSSCSGAIAANYTFQYVDGTVVVNKAVLSAQALDSARPYGTANPNFSLGSFSGFQNADNGSVISGSAVLGTPATASSPPGAYPITVSVGTLSGANYTFQLSPGTLTIEKIIEPVTIVGRAVNKLSVLFYGTLTAPDGTTVVLDSVNCTRLANGTTISKTLPYGSYAVDGTSCTFIPVIAEDYTSDGPITATFTAAPGGITTVTLPPGGLGVGYRTNLAATGVTGTKVWSIASGSLPTGLTMTSAGVISGTPTVPGVYPFTVRLVVGTALDETWVYKITVPAVQVTTTSLPNGQIGVAYRQTLTSNVAKTPAHWTLAGGTLPDGLALSTAGVISGTPGHPGTFTFTVRVADSATPAHSATQTLSITVAPMTITTTSLKNGKAATFYSTALTASGGTSPRTWAVTAGSLPGGLTLSPAGTISGTPAAAGTYHFTVRVTDHVGNTATAALTLVVT